ncbi:hypothetical protein AAFC00_005831 [Neodothiora populina]|uniref:37S ribosomal protein Rsm22 n=1 Tax=Neodothiora populina TaxID=2781224 RepID=A0ABR3P609_9PEZI
MSLVQLHQSACASCRIRSLIAAKQFARTRTPLPSRWSSSTASNSVRPFSAVSRQLSSQQDARSETIGQRNPELEALIGRLDAKLEAEGLTRQAEDDFDVETTDTPVTHSLHSQEVDFEWDPDATLTPEEVARQARVQFGDSLPEDILDAEEYRIYERLFGPPIRILKAGEEEDDLVDFDESEFQGELGEEINVGTGILKEGRDGQLREVEFIEEEEEDDMAEEGEELDELEETDERESREEAVQKLGPGFDELDDKTLADLAALRVESGDQADTDSGYEIFQRTHPLTIANRFTTPASTLQLPKNSLVDPISIILSGLPPKHISDTAHRVFGGPGLPYSASTPRRGLTMPQKPIPLDTYQGRMSEMDADVYAATIMPGVYATAYSIMVETRKRLGSSWLEGLLKREGGPRILDAGGAGAAVLAARDVLRAEWERMHDTSDDPDSVTAIAEAGGKTGGEYVPAPVGRATVLTGSDSLRQRASALLDDTSFLPRLPDYLHASDEEARDKGKFDIIFAPHTLWQIKEDYIRKQHINNLWSLLSSDGGVLIFFEKGVPRGFEMVAAAREMLLDTRLATPGKEDAMMIGEDIYGNPDGQGVQWGKAPREKGMIIAPCTNHLECPMYVKGSGTSKGRKDHCHFTQRYIRPPFLQKILGAKDRNHEDIDFSYLSIMRGRDLRDKDSDGLIQGERATLAAFAGYEDVDAALEASSAAAVDQQEQAAAQQSLDPTAPAIPDIEQFNSTASDLLDANGDPHSLSLPRAVMPPMKRHGHVIMDVCTPSGTLERWTIPKSFSRQAYRDARKAAWGDLWALGAKTRTNRNMRIGRGKEELGGVDSKSGAINVKGKSRKTRGHVPAAAESSSSSPSPFNKNAKKGGKNVIEVGYDADGNIKEEDIKVKNSGRMRSGQKIKGIRDKRDKKGTGNGRRKRDMMGDM